MMICTVHSRTHQIRCARIYADILFMSMLLMDRFCNKASVRCKHKAAKLRVDCNIAHSGRNQHFLIYFPHAFTDHLDIIRFLIRFVRNSDTSGQIDEFNMRTRFLLKLYSNFKKHFRKSRVILVRHRIACKKCMDAEFLCPFCFQDLEGFKDLFGGHAVFRVARVIHDAVGNLEQSTRIVPAADRLRDFSDRLLQKINMCDVIQIDDRTQLCRKTELFRRRIVGRKHDVLSYRAYGF